ncbi:helitron helicase-like domain-containing protein [Artemisia annua]|uniref:Helitron helicase-like domain-containing protein n=1 Tax=Artemisia annua TaxID=35608 RepID=A0A2U1NI35_ARTAN|nr:helitron helicase-like domain-containing protein [Artemisia annua]
MFGFVCCRSVLAHRAAKEIPLEVSQSLDFPGSHSDEVSPSVSVGHSAGINVGHHSTVPVFCATLSSSGQNGLDRTAMFCHTAGATSSTDDTGTGSGVDSGGFGHVNLPTNVSLSHGPVVDAPSRRVNFPAGVPTQVYTIDGLVSTFQIANVVRPSFVAAPQRPTAQDFTSVGNLGRVPMVLDFSSGNVVRDPDSASSNIRTRARQRRILATLRRRTGTCRLLAGEQPTESGPSSTGDADGPPVQGPVAPPQREGAPLEYRSFGRTARDILQQADIPNFSIKLFGVVGAHQYELPTADTVGVIVYDCGPEAVTDYDIVIQRHSGEPESVNKLHPAYMALQFPLLFIYGEEGYQLNLMLRNSDGGKLVS